MEKLNLRKLSEAEIKDFFEKRNDLERPKFPVVISQTEDTRFSIIMYKDLYIRVVSPDKFSHWILAKYSSQIESAILAEEVVEDYPNCVFFKYENSKIYTNKKFFHEIEEFHGRNAKQYHIVVVADKFRKLDVAINWAGKPRLSKIDSLTKDVKDYVSGNLYMPKMELIGFACFEEMIYLKFQRESQKPVFVPVMHDNAFLQEKE